MIKTMIWHCGSYIYLKEKQYRADCNPNRKRAIRKKCQKFRIDDGGEVLYKKKHGQVSL